MEGLRGRDRRRDSWEARTTRDPIVPTISDSGAGVDKSWDESGGWVEGVGPNPTTPTSTSSPGLDGLAFTSVDLS